MIRRAWIVVSAVWTGFLVFAYILGAQGLTAPEQLSLRANTMFMIALPWIAGGVIIWIVTGRRSRQ